MSKEENIKVIIVFYGFSRNQEREDRLWFYAKPLSVSDNQLAQAAEELNYLKEEGPFSKDQEGKMVDIKRLLCEENEYQFLVAQHLCREKPKSPIRSVHTSFSSFVGAVLEYDPSIPCNDWFSVNRGSLMDQLDACFEPVTIDGFKTYLKHCLGNNEWPEADNNLFKAVLKDLIVLAYGKDKILKLIYVDFDEIASIEFDSLELIREVFEDYVAKVSSKNAVHRKSQKFERIMIKTAMVSENRSVKS